MFDRLRAALRTIGAQPSGLAELEAAVERLGDAIARLEDRVAFQAEENRRLAEALLAHVDAHPDRGGRQTS